MRLVLRTLATTSAMALAGCSLFQQDQPHEARITLHLADTALAAGAPALALRVADIVLENRPNDVAAMVAKADALYALGSVDEARDEYSKVVAIQPANADAQIGLGRTLVKSDPHAAERAFQAALAHRPNSEPALNDLGIALDLQGRHAEAQKAYREALTVSPDNADVRTNLNLSVALADTGVNGAGMRPRIATIPQTAPSGSAPIRPAALAPAVVAAASVAAASVAAASVAPASVAPASVTMARDSRIEPVQDENDQTGGTSAPRDRAASHMTPSAPIDVARHDDPPAKPATPPIIAKRATAPEPIAPPPAKVALLTTPGSATEPAAASQPEKATPGLVQPPARQPAQKVSTGKTATPAPAPEPASPPPAPPVMVTADMVTADMVAADGDAEIPVPATSPQPAPAIPPPTSPATSPAVDPATTSTGAPPTQPLEPTKTAPEVSTPQVAADNGKAPSSPQGQTANPPKVASSPTQPAPDAKPAAALHPNRWSVPGYYVQVAALGSPQSAQAEWQRMQARWPDLLAGRAPTVQQADVHQRTFWRLRTGLFATAGSANDFCARLRAAGSDCWAVASAQTDAGDRGPTPLTR